MLRFTYLNIKRSIGNFFRLYQFYKKSGVLPPKGLSLNNLSNISFGTGFSIGVNSQLYCNDHQGLSLISFGKNVTINANVMVNADKGGKIQIGNNVLIGPQVVIRASNHIYSNPSTPIREQGSTSGTIIIEDDVWIAANVVITNNVKIGKGSVIGAGSVVTKDIPPYSVAVGIPAKVIKSRTN